MRLEVIDSRAIQSILFVLNIKNFSDWVTFLGLMEPLQLIERAGGVPIQASDAVGCLGLDGDCPAAVRAACPEAFLLQFGALLNEPSAAEVRQSLLFYYLPALNST